MQPGESCIGCTLRLRNGSVVSTLAATEGFWLTRAVCRLPTSESASLNHPAESADAAHCFSASFVIGAKNASLCGFMMLEGLHVVDESGMGFLF